MKISDVTLRKKTFFILLISNLWRLYKTGASSFMRERYPQVHYEIEVGLDAVTLRLVEAIPEQVAQINGEIRACLDEIDALAVEQFKLELAEDGDA